MSNVLPVAQPDQPTGSRWDRRDKLHLAGITGFVILLNVTGWGVLILAVAPQNFTLGRAGVYGVGLGITAFLLGVRHAFDADHIAVIDNATRKLVGEGKTALGVGFWFSLGHSTIVFGAALFLALGAQALAGTVHNAGSALLQTLGLAVRRRCRAVVGESMRLPRPGLWPRRRFRADHGGVCRGGRRFVYGAVFEPVG
jgi:high-affinity nickel-transport protein